MGGVATASITWHSRLVLVGFLGQLVIVYVPAPVGSLSATSPLPVAISCICKSRREEWKKKEEGESTPEFEVTCTGETYLETNLHRKA